MTAGFTAKLLRRAGAEGSASKDGGAEEDAAMATGPVVDGAGVDGAAGESSEGLLHGVVRAAFYRFTAQQFHLVLGQALRALPAKAQEQERAIAVLDDLHGHLQAYETDARRDERFFEAQVSDGCRRLGKFVDDQRRAARLREQELSDVVDMLTRSMADVTSENADLCKDIRAENARINEAARQDDLRRLRSVLREVTKRLNGLVADKESRDQSRIASLATQVEALKSELSEMRRRADLDPMTQQLNRRRFDEVLSTLVLACRGTRRGFSMIIFDLDDFKAINDRYGHHVGDRALIAFARHCRAQMRSRDTFARIGGEEFGMLLEGASLRSALKRATKICEGIARQPYSVDEAGEQLLRLTASAGVTAFCPEDTEMTMFKRADAALYRAKAEGKNRAIAG